MQRERQELQRLLEDEQRKTAYFLKTIGEIADSEEGFLLRHGFMRTYEEIGKIIQDCLLYTQVLSPAERQQADEASAALEAAEDEAVFSRQGV